VHGNRKIIEKKDIFHQKHNLQDKRILFAYISCLPDSPITDNKKALQDNLEGFRVVTVFFKLRRSHL
jgi:hypothetical protein